LLEIHRNEHCEVMSSVLTATLVSGLHYQSLSKIWCKSVLYWPIYRRLTYLKMEASAILDFGRL